MTDFRNILFCPLTEAGAAPATRRVGELATRHQAAVTMFGVVPEPVRFRRARNRFDDLRDVILERECAEVADSLRRRAPRIDGEAHVEVETGNAALEIIQQVLAADHDLVIVTADDDDHATLKRLLRKCPCPVWVLRPDGQRTQRVLVAVHAEPDEQGLNHHLLELGVAMHETFGGELHVVHSWQLWGEATMRGSAFMDVPAAELEQLLEEEAAEHAGMLDDLLVDAGVRQHPWHVHIEKGPATRVITDCVDRLHINLLVMGTVARSRLAGVLMGNTAEQVIDDVPCSMLVAKPPGFVSPVAPKSR